MSGHAVAAAGSQAAVIALAIVQSTYVSIQPKEAPLATVSRGN